jgi:hypothetical protein
MVQTIIPFGGKDGNAVTQRGAGIRFMYAAASSANSYSYAKGRLTQGQTDGRADS